MSKVDIYKANQRKAKWLKVAAPIVFWGCWVLAIICFILALKHSLGAVEEITTLLDTATHTGEELESNYNMLIGKYGEWVIGHGGTAFQIVFINLKRAVFSPFVTTNFIMTAVFIAAAFLLGKWLLPTLSAKITNENQDMVNLTVLEKDKNE